MPRPSSRLVGVMTTSHSRRTPRATASTGSKLRDRSSQATTDPAAWADGLDPGAYYQPFDALHAGARPLVVGPNAEDVIVAVGKELHPAVAGIVSVDEAVTRAARRAEALLAG